MHAYTHTFYRSVVARNNRFYRKKKKTVTNRFLPLPRSVRGDPSRSGRTRLTFILSSERGRGQGWSFPEGDRKSGNSAVGVKEKKRERVCVRRRGPCKVNYACRTNGNGPQKVAGRAVHTRSPQWRDEGVHGKPERARIRLKRRSEENNCIRGYYRLQTTPAIFVWSIVFRFRIPA